MMCFMEKMFVLDKLCLGMNYKIPGYEFDVNELKYKNKVSSNRNILKIYYKINIF